MNFIRRWWKSVKDKEMKNKMLHRLEALNRRRDKLFDLVHDLRQDEQFWLKYGRQPHRSDYDRQKIAIVIHEKREKLKSTQKKIRFFTSAINSITAYLDNLEIAQYAEEMQSLPTSEEITSAAIDARQRLEEMAEVKNTTEFPEEEMEMSEAEQAILKELEQPEPENEEEIDPEVDLEAQDRLDAIWKSSTTTKYYMPERTEPA